MSDVPLHGLFAVMLQKSGIGVIPDTVAGS